MADRLLVDLGGDGQAVVQVWPEGGLPELVARVPLAWPLDGDALEDLRWYLEDYLRAPFGVWEQRGPAIQGRLGGWGDDLPRTFRTADLWLIHAADCRSRYSSWTCCGVRYCSPECLRLELYQNSM